MSAYSNLASNMYNLVFRMLRLISFVPSVLLDELILRVIDDLGIKNYRAKTFDQFSRDEIKTILQLVCLTSRDEGQIRRRIKKFLKYNKSFVQIDWEIEHFITAKMKRNADFESKIGLFISRITFGYLVTVNGGVVKITLQKADGKEITF